MGLAVEALQEAFLLACQRFGPKSTENENQRMRSKAQEMIVPCPCLLECQQAARRSPQPQTREWDWVARGQEPLERWSRPGVPMPSDLLPYSCNMVDC